MGCTTRRKPSVLDSTNALPEGICRSYAKMRARLRQEDKAARKAFPAARRAAKGLPPIKSSTQRAQDARARKEARWQAYLAGAWWSPELSEREAKAVLAERYPNRTEIERHTDYVSLAEQCRAAALNLNRFTIALEGEDGVAKAREQRAILHEITHGTLNDLVANVEKAAAIPNLQSMESFQGMGSDETWIENMCRKSRDAAQIMWGRGERVLQAMKTKSQPWFFAASKCVV